LKEAAKETGRGVGEFQDGPSPANAATPAGPWR
jgi:hypothetical protein